ncbi:MAG TPA: hypothetical protein VK636_06650 [Gemmatimonadaceae bacterium]|nr:hypothetical protein [Gemmatimonadaceae bacterium]
MLNLDITKCNIAIDKLLEVTTNRRHRFLLMAYARHRHLEFSGHYDDVLTDEMMNDHPVYTIRALGVDTTINGREEVRALYKNWAETNQCVFYIENEQVAVADNFIASRVTSYQQIWGGTLKASKVLGILPKGLTHDLFIKMLEFKGLKADVNSMYLYKAHEQWFWPYDDRGRLLREDILEPDRSTSEVIKLEPGDVLTAAQASVLLAPLIKPLPNYDEYVLGK